MTVGATMTRKEKLAELEALVGDDGTGDLGVIVDCAEPDTTIDDLAEIVREAEADALVERERLAAQ